MQGLKSLGAVFACLLALCATPVAAQQVWLQIEARPGLARAREAASDYARRIENIAGFRLGSSDYYAIAIGPLSPAEADRRRRALSAARLIPGDAFTTEGERFGTQFWPIGATVAPDAPGNPQVHAEAQPRDAEVSVAEARRSEQSLGARERRELQAALEWAGFYDGAIDGIFGRGTRSAMAAWQRANGHAASGVLTAAQRATLMSDYNAVLDGLGLEPVRDETAGIEIEIPLGEVAFDRYEPPFAHYAARDGGDVPRVLLISQKGDRARLRGLYEVMQTLEIVPPEGPRERSPTGFTLVGEGTDLISHTEARLQDGAIKGFTLIWPTGDEARRTRLIDEMRASFERIDGAVMPDTMGPPDESQNVDLLAGLELRRPATTRSGFYVSRRGQVLTTADAATGCERITIGGDIEARVIGIDERLGLALLDPAEALAPRVHAAFKPGVPRLGSDAVLAGFPWGGVLGAPTLSWGTLAAFDGLDGEEAVRRYALAARPGDAGGPVLDPTGAVLGALLPAPLDGRSLPEDVAFATDVDAIESFLTANGIAPDESTGAERLPRGALERRASDMAVRVGCWR